MLVLALDTTTRGGSVAVTRDDDLLGLVEGDPARTHGERLPAEIDQALVSAGVRARDLDLLAVASGPGAFTGLRIGLAAVQGLAMVLDKPVAGVSALDALVENAAPRDGDAAGSIAAWMDAQRGEVFAACYRARCGAFEALSAPSVGLPAALLADLPLSATDHVMFTGDGAVRYRGLIEATLGHRALVVTELRPLAPAVARLGRRAALAGRAGAPHALQPIYLRRPDAELDRARGKLG